MQDRIPNHYIFIANRLEWEPESTAEKVTRTLLEARFWLASPYTPYRQNYKEGDRALFYAAGPKARWFQGDAIIASKIRESTQAEALIAIKLGLDRFEETIPLKAVRIWQEPLLLKPLVDEMSFIKDKRNWGLNLRQAAARLSKEDYELILSHGNIG